MKFFKSSSSLNNRLTFLFFLVFINVQLFGQNSGTSVKIYSNFNFVAEDDFLSFDPATNKLRTDETRSYDLGYFSPAFIIRTDSGNFHEFELSRLLLNQDQSILFTSNDSIGGTELISALRTTEFLFAFRYEYNIAISSVAEETKIQSYIGFSIQPFFEASKTMPLLSPSYSTSQNRFGALLAIVPRVNYDIKENLFLDFNIPITLLETNVNFNETENPQLTEVERNSTVFNVKVLPVNFMLRIGIGLRI